jgi:hypothetical protein
MIQFVKGFLTDLKLSKIIEPFVHKKLFCEVAPKILALWTILNRFSWNYAQSTPS